MSTRVAVVGSGHIGTDLMVKVMRTPGLELAAMVGIDAASTGLARAAQAGVPVTAGGISGFMSMPGFGDIEIIFDATSARAHMANARALAGTGKRLIDLTPAAIGPFVVPAVNLSEHLDSPNINMVTCGGQATVPVVAAVSREVTVAYAEIVASIASRSAGPGTRANIDEFTETTARALSLVGGATRGKAVIILNPAEPPLLMRDTVLCLVTLLDDGAAARVTGSVEAMVAEVAAYVPGYRLKQAVRITPIAPDLPLHTLIDVSKSFPTHQVSVFIEVEGAADHLPAFAGNLDIMTSAAIRVAEQIGRRPIASVEVAR